MLLKNKKSMKEDQDLINEGGLMTKGKKKKEKQKNYKATQLRLTPT